MAGKPTNTDIADTSASLGLCPTALLRRNYYTLNKVRHIVVGTRHGASTATVDGSTYHLDHRRRLKLREYHEGWLARKRESTELHPTAATAADQSQQAGQCAPPATEGASETDRTVAATQ